MTWEQGIPVKSLSLQVHIFRITVKKPGLSFTWNTWTEDGERSCVYLSLLEFYPNPKANFIFYVLHIKPFYYPSFHESSSSNMSIKCIDLACSICPLNVSTILRVTTSNVQCDSMYALQKVLGLQAAKSEAAVGETTFIFFFHFVCQISLRIRPNCFPK